MTGSALRPGRRLASFTAGMKRIIQLHDPRHYQIAVLASLVCYGVVVLDFGIQWQNAVTIVTAALTAQYLGTLVAGLPRFRSAQSVNHLAFADAAAAHG